MTGAPGGGIEARPMTSVSGAGYQGGKENKAFDPLNLGSFVKFNICSSHGRYY